MVSSILHDDPRPSPGSAAPDSRPAPGSAAPEPSGRRPDGGCRTRCAPRAASTPAPLAAAGRVLRAAAVPFLLAPSLLALAACGNGESGSGAEGAQAAPSGTPVETAVARRETLSSTVRAVGTLEADARVEVRPELDGHVTAIEFEEGQEVREGQVLVRLDQDKLRAQAGAARAAVKRARTTASNLERRLARNDSLLAAGAISEQAYDDLEAEYESAEAALDESEANLELAEQRLEDATIRAPFGGRVGAREFHLGDYVQLGQTLFTVVDDDPLEVQFSVPERYLGRLEVGSPVRVTVRSDPERPVTGEVSFVSPYVDPSTRTVELKARVPNPASELRAGQFASVVLELESRQGVVVPEAAVVPRQDRRLVYVVRGGTARERTVRLGQRSRGSVELLSGASAGDTVVVAGHQRLSDGAAVSVAGGEAGGVGPPEEGPPGTDASSGDGDGAPSAGGEG